MDDHHRAWYIHAMTTLSIDIFPETAADALSIEKLHERAFGPGRFARTAFRLREGEGVNYACSFVARVGTFLVGSVRLSPITIGATPALLLGPLTVEPAFTSRGIGTALVNAALDNAREHGHRLVLLVGDEPYYARAGFRRVPLGQVDMPGPVDMNRLLVHELVPDAFNGITGMLSQN
jgi:predicted N-acetyltransferase YhbS